MPRRAYAASSFTVAPRAPPTLLRHGVQGRLRHDSPPAGALFLVHSQTASTAIGPALPTAVARKMPSDLPTWPWAKLSDSFSWPWAKLSDSFSWPWAKLLDTFSWPRRPSCQTPLHDPANDRSRR